MSDQPSQPALQPAGLRWLACPVCRQPLALDAAAARCNGCGRRYPIVDGIPVLIADRTS